MVVVGHPRRPASRAAVIYLESSALIKLLVTEAETAVLQQWLRARDDQDLASSDLAVTEVTLACRRHGSPDVAAVRRLLAGLSLTPISRAVVERAGDAFDPSLRSLDAIHLATVQALGDVVTAVVTYDRRLLAAAQAAGLPTAHPGVAG